MKARILVVFILIIHSTFAQQNEVVKKMYKCETFDFESNFSCLNSKIVLEIESCKFHGSASFIKDTYAIANICSNDFFNGNFELTTYNKAAYFMRNSFTDVSFHNSRFHGHAFFTLSTFKNNANFNNTVFDTLARFDGCRFEKEVYFVYSEFLKEVNFVGTYFGNYADFSNARIHEKIYLQATTLPEYLNLSGIKILGSDFDLTESIIDRKHGICKINLLNADIDKIRLRYSMFELYFPDSIESDMKSSIYEQLLKRQKDDGFTSSYEKLDKEYREFQNLESGKYGFLWGRIRNFSGKNWWGYGYDKELIFRNTGIIFLFFLIINWTFFSWISQTIYEIPRLTDAAKAIQAKNSFCRFIKRFPIATFYTALIFFGLKFSIENLKYKENLVGWRFLNLIYFFIIYITGLICLAYMANYVLSN